MQQLPSQSSDTLLVMEYDFTSCGAIILQSFVEFAASSSCEKIIYRSEIRGTSYPLFLFHFVEIERCRWDGCFECDFRDKIFNDISVVFNSICFDLTPDYRIEVGVGLF